MRSNRPALALKRGAHTVRQIESWIAPGKNRSLFLLRISQHFLSPRIFPLTGTSISRSTWQVLFMWAEISLPKARAAAMLQIHGYSAVSPEFISILVYIIRW